jgi:thioredoxin 1
LSQENPSITFLKVDIDDVEELANRFSVSSIPCFLFFKNGKEVNRLVGANEAKLEALIKELK